MTTSKHDGAEERATERVSWWLAGNLSGPGDGESTCRAWERMVRAAVELIVCEPAGPDRETARREQTYALAADVKSWAEDAIGDGPRMGLVGELVGYMLACVDWDGIASTAVSEGLHEHELELERDAIRERNRIVALAEELDARQMAADACAAGPGKFEGADDLSLVVALYVLSLHGAADEQYGSVEYGAAAVRVGRYLLVEDDQGFCTAVDGETVSGAETIGAEYDERKIREHVERAAADHARTAATWAVDGDWLSMRAALAGLHDGDPLYVDMLPGADENGAVDAILDATGADEWTDIDPETADTLTAAYVDAFNDAIGPAVESLLIRRLGPDPTTGLDMNGRYRVNGSGAVAYYLTGPAGPGAVLAVMVGDDREHVVNVDDLDPIGPDDYCHECGQIGCTADGRER